MIKRKKISVVIPCFRSSQTISPVVAGITDTMGSHTDEYDYEIILVNDGSPDDTFSVISELARKDSHIISVDLSRNFGQHSALMAAYSQVTGDYVLGMDDDGEHDPKDMFQLIAKLEEGEYDYVCAKFPSSNHSIYKRLGSKVNDWMATKFIGKPKDAIFSSYYVMRRYVVDEILKSSNPNPYVGGMIVSVTRRMASVPLNQHARLAGDSGYHFRNSVSLWLNGVTAFSVQPLRIASFIGILFSAIGFCTGISVIIRKIVNPEILAGYTSNVALLMLIGGLILAVLGMIGEYVGRIYLLINHIPQYTIRSVVRVSKDEKDIER